MQPSSSEARISESRHVPSLTPVHGLHEAQQPRRELRPADRNGEFVGGIEPHCVTTTLLIDGMVFAHCLCGANSLPLLTVDRARMWLCPRQDAEATIARNAALLASALERVHAFERGR